MAAPDPDVEVRLHRDHWHSLTDKALRLIGIYCGPVTPDERTGIVTLRLSESRWREIWAAMERE